MEHRRPGEIENDAARLTARKQIIDLNRPKYNKAPGASVYKL